MPQVLEPASSIRITRKKKPSSSFRERDAWSPRDDASQPFHTSCSCLRLWWGWGDLNQGHTFAEEEPYQRQHLPETLLLISKHLCAHKNTDTLTFLSFWITKNINICFSSGDTVSSSAVSWEGRLARSSRFCVITLFWFFTWSPEHCMWDKAQASSSFLLIRVTSHLVYPLSVSELKYGCTCPFFLFQTCF